MVGAKYMAPPLYDGRTREPFLRHLMDQGAACPDRPPVTANGLRAYVAGSQRPHKETPWFEAWMQGWHGLREWARSPDAFRPPTRWTTPAARQLRAYGVDPDDVTPSAIRDFWGVTAHRDRLSAWRRCYGVIAISAFVNGWPRYLTANDVRMAFRWPQVVVFFCRPQLDALPLHGSGSIGQRIRAREKLMSHPLTCGYITVNRGLPPEARMPEYLLRMPRHPWEAHGVQFAVKP